MESIYQPIAYYSAEPVKIIRKSNRIYETAFFEENQAPCCDEPLLAEMDGYLVCKNCGMTTDRIIENSPRRAYTQDEILNRKSNEIVYSPIGPRTVIRGNCDSSGAMLPAKDQSKFNRLSKIQRSLTSSYERNLWIALPNFSRMQERLSLSQPVSEVAMKIYTRGVKERLTMGRSIDILLSGSILLSSKIHNIPLTVDEIMKVADVTKKSVLKCYRVLIDKILPGLKIKVARLGPMQYLQKFGTELNLSLPMSKYAGEILQRANGRSHRLDGKDPKGIAAGAIYLASRKFKEKFTQTEIARCSHITEVTLRLRARELVKYCSL